MRRWVTVLIVGCTACAVPARGGALRTLAPWLLADPQRCLLQRDLREGMESMARRCAERFVLENGYTEFAAADSTRWVHEAGDADEWPRVFVTRTGLLASRASSIQCSRRECVVLFRVRRPVPQCAFRAVVLTQVFTRIRLEPGGIRDTRCTERHV